MSMRESLSAWLTRARENRVKWKKAMFVFLGLLLVLNIFIHPHHPHVAAESVIGFWAVFGFIGAVVMTFVLKKIVFPLISRSEDFYERD